MKLIDIITKKDIAIVGGSTSILSAKQGETIDSHDCVIRLNLRFPNSNEYESVGKKTTLFYCGAILRITNKRLIEYAKITNLLKLQKEWQIKGTANGIPCFLYNEAIQQKLIGHINIFNANEPYVDNLLIPNTGMVCIYDCLISHALKITLYGFDAFTTPNRYSGFMPNHKFLNSMQQRLRFLLNNHLVCPDIILEKMRHNGQI
jgi:hypothetical protein